MASFKQVPHTSLDIPSEVSGRTVTNRGVHLQPFGFHGDWLKKAPYWTELMASMGISWVVLITDGDSVRQTYHGTKSPLESLLEAGIIPIIREQKAFPEPFTEQDTVLWSVDLYGKYGLKPFWIIRNEPFDDREWRNRFVPPNAWDVIMGIWAEGAKFIADKGGYVGFPDGPGYDFNPFVSIQQYDLQWIFDQGSGFYTGHHYGKNRPRDYPYDAVTRYGAQLTKAAYRRLLDDFHDDERWREEPIELLNQRRSQLKLPTLTASTDDVCWRGWELVAHWSEQTFGYVVPMAMTEGGWVPRDRPGSGPNTDIRMPHTTPKMVAKRTLQMYDTPSPFFAICPWLLADQDMGGSGWPFDAWHGWAYSEKYGAKKPVIKALQSFPPKETKTRTLPLVIDVNGDTRNMTWLHNRHGTGYRRGETRLQLIELHEYQGPATFDVWVVDGAGLPVKGVPFYCYHADAPEIDGDEWYPQGRLRRTDAKGRISFKARGKPAAAGKGTGAIWPQGRGDVLERLAMLPGGDNRHINGLWQLVDEGTPPLGPQPRFRRRPRQSTPLPTVRSATIWVMTVSHRPGPKIIAGSLPRSGIKVTISDPWGNATTVVSGSKPEHGPGGFEVLAPHPVQHTLTFLGETFSFKMKDRAAYVTFTETGATPSEPEQEPAPKPEPKPVTEPLPRSLEELWADVLDRLEKIEELAKRLPPV